MYIYIYIYTYIHLRAVRRGGLGAGGLGPQDSSKGGAVETGCSDLYDVMYSFTI